jgi:hypothetical protein
MTKKRIAKGRIRDGRTGNGSRKVKGKVPSAADNPRSRFAKLRGRATVTMTTEEILALTRGK